MKNLYKVLATQKVKYVGMVLETREIQEENVLLPYANEKRTWQLIKEDAETKGLTPCGIVENHLDNVKYSMPLRYFMKHATIIGQNEKENENNENY